VLKKLYGELVTIAKSPEMKEPFERNGADPVTTTPAELTKLMASELDKYKKVIKAANITLK
jgi:tripartite-type tricarboxylate transporter receptor subunit TctC